MLDREKLRNADLKNIFGHLECTKYQTEEELQRSMHEMLAQNPHPDQPIWVFAYGSLIWNPVIEFAERKKAFLPEWQRAFCMKLLGGRGSEKAPGRMLALVPGDGVTGVAYRLHPDNLCSELHLIWKREMCTKSYIPLWADVVLEDNTTANALVFVMRECDPTYDRNAEVNHVAPFILQAQGPLGRNVDYVSKLQSALNLEGIMDHYIECLSNHLKALDIN